MLIGQVNVSLVALSFGAVRGPGLRDGCRVRGESGRRHHGGRKAIVAPRSIRPGSGSGRGRILGPGCGAAVLPWAQDGRGRVLRGKIQSARNHRNRARDPVPVANGRPNSRLSGGAESPGPRQSAQGLPALPVTLPGQRLPPTTLDCRGDSTTLPRLSRIATGRIPDPSFARP